MFSRIKFRFSIEHLWGLIIIMGIFVFVNTHPIRPHDFWWHITIGREILTTGRIPAADVYSYTEAGQPYPSYQMFWLMETLLYVFYKVGGAALVVFLQSLMITAAYIEIFWICKLATSSWRIAALSVLFAAALGINDWNVRPQGVTFLLASLLLLAIYKYKQNPHWGWLVVFPLCMLVWVNSHGTFIIGLVFIGLWWGQELWQAILVRIKHEHIIGKNRIIVPGMMLGVTALACLVNPRGFGIVDYLRTLTSNSVVQNLVTEWAPPTFGSWMGAIFLCGLMACAVLLVVSPKRAGFFQIVTFLVFGLLGLKTSRGIVWFGLVMAPIIAEHLSAIAGRIQPVERRPVNREGSRSLNLFFAIVIISMGVISLPWFKSSLPLPTVKAGLISVETPVQATQVLLGKNLPGRVFNAMSFGSYLIWAAYPHYQVFVDSRIELFPEKIWLDYLNISNAEGDWEARLSDYGVNTLILSPNEQYPLIKSIDTSNSWSRVYQDEAASIYTRIK